MTLTYTVVGWTVNTKAIFRYGGDAVGRRVRMPNLLCRQEGLAGDSHQGRSPADSGIKPRHWTVIISNGRKSCPVSGRSPRDHVGRAGFAGNLQRRRSYLSNVARGPLEMRSWIALAASAGGCITLNRLPRLQPCMARAQLILEAAMMDQLVLQRSAATLDRGIIVAIPRVTDTENHAPSGF